LYFFRLFPKEQRAGHAKVTFLAVMAQVESIQKEYDFAWGILGRCVHKRACITDGMIEVILCNILRCQLILQCTQL